MTIRRAIRDAVRTTFPRQLVRLKAVRHRFTSVGERDLRFVQLVIRPGRNAVDIGVHSGVYSVEMARHAKMVHSFEINPKLNAVLRKSLPQNVVLHEFGLSSQAGSVLLRMPVDTGGRANDDRATIAIANTLDGMPTCEIDAEVKLLDALSLSNIDFVKMDVEGHEEDVMAGAEAFTNLNRPVFLVELENRHNPGVLQRMNDRFTSLSYFPALSVGEPNNFFFVPKERFQERERLQRAV